MRERRLLLFHEIVVIERIVVTLQNTNHNISKTKSK